MPQVPEESTCRSSKEYRFTEVGLYAIHATALMPDIPFEEAAELPESIDETIFLNIDDTKLEFPTQTTCQNYLTTRYTGRAPLEYYSGDQKTEMGRQFSLRCVNGNPAEKYRSFSSEAANQGFNRGASDASKLPGGGEE